MDSYFIILLALLLLVIIPGIQRRRRLAAVRHILNRKKQNKENIAMKELAQKFIGKECLVYTVASDSNSVNGTIKEITDTGLLIENDGYLQVVNLEYVTRIREWPRKKNGRKKEIVLD